MHMPIAERLDRNVPRTVKGGTGQKSIYLETVLFDCGKPPLNDFLIKYALQNQASGGARTYAMTRVGVKS